MQNQAKLGLFDTKIITELFFFFFGAPKLPLIPKVSSSPKMNLMSYYPHQKSKHS